MDVSTSESVVKRKSAIDIAKEQIQNLCNSFKKDPQQYVEYCTPVLDLRNVFRSYQFNILYRVNKEIDAWRTAANEEDRVKHYGAAERFAKVAANAIIANVQAHGSNDNQFFIDTARGMITGFILLVALYAPPTARHIISVFELVVQCSAPESLPAPGAQQRTMIASLMEHINDRRIQELFAGLLRVSGTGHRVSASSSDSKIHTSSGSCSTYDSNECPGRPH